MILTVVCVSDAAWAQEALRTSLAAEQVAEQRRLENESRTYNLRWHDLRISFRASADGEYNDNVRYSNARRQSDFVLRPLFGIDATQPIGQANVLHLQVTLGYEKYFEQDDLSRLYISPNTELSFDIFVKEVRINVHDRLDYQLDPGLQAAVSGVGRFGGLHNTAGVSAIWDLNNLITTLGYDYLLHKNADEVYSYLDRGTHQFFARSGWKVHPAVTFGPEASAGRTVYDEGLLNDSLGLSAGAYGEWRISEVLRLEPRVGYSYYTFDENPISGPQPDSSAYYFDLGLQHSVNARLKYTLRAARAITPGTYGNLNDEWSVRLDATMNVVRRTSLNAGVSFESGDETLRGATESYDRYGFRIGASYPLARRMEAALNYTLYLRSSSEPARDYTLNRISLALNYRF